MSPENTSQSSIFVIGYPDFNYNKEHISNTSVTIFDSGDACFSPTSSNLVGKGVAAIMPKLEETKNRYLAISSFTMSQNEILKILEEETGEEWAQGHVSTDALEKIGLEKLGQKNPLGVLDLMKAFQFQDGQDRALSEEANDARALGSPSEDVLTLVRSLILI
ncbi:hypothetical protein CEP53_007685 [Fusarium sp. AF-6]|nr:hypothetical protein CEP53_007685 [Fusarium sp. AF-6]